MQLEIETGAGRYAIRGYDGQAIAVNDVALKRTFVIMPDLLIEDWAPESLSALSAAHLQTLLPYEPEVVIVGSGQRLLFPDPAVTEPLRRAGIGHEVMDTVAACRCFAVLAGEHRRVLAIIFPLSS